MKEDVAKWIANLYKLRSDLHSRYEKIIYINFDETPIYFDM